MSDEHIAPLSSDHRPGPLDNRKSGLNSEGEKIAETPQSRADRFANQINSGASGVVSATTIQISLPSINGNESSPQDPPPLNNPNRDVGEEDIVEEEEDEDEFHDNSPIMNLRMELTMRSSRLLQLDEDYIAKHKMLRDNAAESGGKGGSGRGGSFAALGKQAPEPLERRISYKGVGDGADGKWEGRKASFFIGGGVIKNTKDRKSEVCSEVKFVCVVRYL